MKTKQDSRRANMIRDLDLEDGQLSTQSDGLVLETLDLVPSVPLPPHLLQVDSKAHSLLPDPAQVILQPLDASQNVHVRLILLSELGAEG